MILFDEAKQLVTDALGELTNDECPRCNCGGLVSGCVGDDDIAKFLRQHKLVKSDTQSYCVTCGEDIGKEFLFTRRPHMCRR